MNPIITKIHQQAQSQIKTIVLPESDDPRVLQAAASITQNKIAKIILLGDPSRIETSAKDLHLDLTDIEIVNPPSSPHLPQLTNQLYELRKEKGLTLDQAQELIKSPLYFGTMLVHQNLADGLVGGANNTTAETFRPALQIIKASPSQKIVSSFFMMISPDTNFGHQGLLLFADCGINIDPTDEQLANIAIQTGDSFKSLCSIDPIIALLSYSTHGSGQGPSVDKVKNATKIAQNLRPDLLYEGEIQADTAIVPSVCSSKCPNCQIAGNANVLIFPNLDAGNISYKLVQRLGNIQAFGPISQGLNKPINDLSRGCNVEDIITTVAITAIQASAPTSR